MCVAAGELPPAAHDLQLGEIGGVPFYIDEELYERWGRPAFLLDVSPGPAEGFSLDALEETHLVTRTA